MVKVFVAVPTTDTIVDSQIHALREIESRYKGQVELVYPDKLVRRMFHDFARNGLVDDFLATDCDILWFLDSDITPPVHVLDLVTRYGKEWQVAGAPYPVFMAQPGESTRQVLFTAYKSPDGIGLHPTRIPNSGIDWVDGLATGCMFIRREVFAKLEKPYFSFKYEEATRNIVEGEDLGFCLKMKALGVRFFTDYSMVCKHLKTIDLLELNDYAIEFAKKAILAMDQSIRERLQEKMKPAPTLNKSKIILPSSLVAPR